MSLDIIKQNMQSVADALRAYHEIESSPEKEDKQKKEQLRNYILRLCYNSQKAIDDERAAV